MRSQSLVLKVLIAVCLASALCSVEARGEVLDLIIILELPGGQVNSVGGLAPEGTNLYTGDIVGGDPATIGYHHIHGSTGGISSSGGVPNSDGVLNLPTGAAMKGDNLLMTVFTGQTTGIMEFAPGGAVAAVYQLQGTESNIRSKGLTWDGRFVWQAHYSPDQGHLFAIDPATGDRVNDLQVDPYAFGLAWDGRYFYVSHHAPSSSSSYIAKYDRSGVQLDTYLLPGEMSPTAAIGDMAINDCGLYAHVLGSNTVARFEMPSSSSSPPSPPSSVLSYSVKTEAGIGYDGGTVADSQTGVGYGQLPSAASLDRRTSDGGMNVASLARTYYDEAGTHNMVRAFAFGLHHESELLADATVTVSKTLNITPSSSGLPAGTAIRASGKLTFNGFLRAFRCEGEGWPEADGLSALLRTKVIKTEPGSDVTCFDGSVSLLGQEGSDWVRAVLAGGANTVALQQVCTELAMDDDFASLELDNIIVGFSVPAIIGQAFDVDIIFYAQVFVPELAYGLAAEVAFGGIDGDLSAEYAGPDGGPESYDDVYEGGYWQGWPGWDPIPEPSSALLLVTGGLLSLWRRRKGIRAG